MDEGAGYESALFLRPVLDKLSVENMWLQESQPLAEPPAAVLCNTFKQCSLDLQCTAAVMLIAHTFRIVFHLAEFWIEAWKYLSRS